MTAERRREWPRVLAGAGGGAGIVVAVAVAVTERGGPVGEIGGSGLEVSLSLLALAWAMFGLLGAVARWRNAWVPGMLMLVGGAGGYDSLPDQFLVPGVVLVIAGVATLVRGLLERRGRREAGPDGTRA